MTSDQWREWFLVSWMYRIAKEKPMDKLPNVTAFPGDRAERCEYSEIPRILKPGERALHVAGEKSASDIQRCFRCWRILSDEGMGEWPTGTWLEERKANHYTEWTVIE